jgi:hypothetical protein
MLKPLVLIRGLLPQQTGPREKNEHVGDIYSLGLLVFQGLDAPRYIYIYIYTGEFGSIKNRKSNEENEKKKGLAWVDMVRAA